jgi:hypothetical protein
VLFDREGNALPALTTGFQLQPPPPDATPEVAPR